MIHGIFDSHAHYGDPSFDEDREELLAELPDRGVCGVLDIGCCLESSRSSAALAAGHETVWAAAGYHPEHADLCTEEGLAEIEELLARIRVALKKSAGTETQKNSQQASAGSPQLSWGALRLDPARHTVTYDGQNVELTKREFVLLQTLLENKSVVLSRDTLLDRVWGYDYMGETNVVDVYVYYLRNKIDDVFGVKMIQTVRGVGYVIKDETP